MLESIITNIEKLPKWIMAIIRSGLYWHILCAVIFYLSWHLWPNDTYRFLLSLGFFLCILLSGAYPYSWSILEKQSKEKWALKENDYERAINYPSELKGRLASTFLILYGARNKQEWPDGMNEAWETLKEDLEI